MCNSATITEAKRQGAVELTEKLRNWIEMHQRSIALDMSLQNHMYYRGWISSLEELSLRLDELAPPVTCDNPPRAGVVGESMQHEIDYCVDTLMCLGPSDLRKVVQQLAADDPAQAERLRRAFDVPDGHQRAVVLPPVVRPEFHVEED